MAIKKFDARDELRATADRRKVKSGSAASSADAVNSHEGIPEIAARLADMFPSLSKDIVQEVLSQLFRSDAHVTREALAEKAVCILLEMALPDGATQTITDFEPAFMKADLTPSAPPECDLVAGDGGDETAPEAAYNSEDALCTDGGISIDDHKLDECLANVLGLPDDELKQCVQTLISVLDRITVEPGNEKIRRLRLANVKFNERVGRHKSAVDFLRFAGFVDNDDDGADDRALVCFADPADAAFLRAQEALRGVAEHLLLEAPSIASPAAKSSGYAGSRRELRSEAPTLARPATNSSGYAVSRREDLEEAKQQRRSRIAALTEERVKDPRGFQAKARARGAAANRVIQNVRLQPSAPLAAPRDGKRHFNLDDIERMRVDDEIAGTTNYADEYRRTQQSGPARDYTTLVARGYDPELIAREALDGTNQYRATKHLAPLRWHDGIARIATQHAEQMARGEMPFSHDGFDARVRAFPVGHRGAGENLALNQGVAAVAKAAVDGWIKSPGHEKNLRGAWHLCGIGAARSSNGTWYLTQLFAAC